jgi:conserved domain protein
MRHIIEEKAWQTPARMAENIQQGNQPDLVCDQTIHRPHEGIADPGNPLQAPLNHNYSGNQRDAKNNVLPTTT